MYYFSINFTQFSDIGVLFNADLKLIQTFSESKI